MCGFAGVIAFDDRYRVTRDVLSAMSRCIAHRGPDGEGVFFEDSSSPLVALAHRRLAILDPDPRANQPFADARGRQLIFNGEIYNFRELRDELTKRQPDRAWRTTGDTEVLLAAYDAWGEDCLHHVEGMYALAIWDPVTRSVFLARDRMGQKPLYLAMMPSADGHGVGAIAFASELAALRHVPWVEPTLDRDALGLYLRFGYIPSPLTIYESCEKLPPARWMRVTEKGIEVEQYFDANEPLMPKQVASLGDDLPRIIRECVTDRIQSQLVSDVPLGCFLSGGIDSSIVAAAMKAAAGDVRTFSIGFDDPRYDETKYAAEVAKHLGTKHHSFTVRPDAANDLPKLAAVFGEPFGDSSALPTHYLARETRQHVKVALSGDGGDELFAGYDRYRAMWLAESFRAMPAPLRKIALNKIWEHLPGTHPKSSGARLKRLLASLSLPADQRYDGYMRFFDDAQLATLMRQPAGDEKWLSKQFAAMHSDVRDVVEAALALDRVTYLPEDLLTKVDRAAMMHALEVRSPFMDHALVNMAAGLKTEQFLGARGGAAAFMQSPMTAPAKRLLREAFAGDLPPQVFKRPKMGFAVPIGEWFRGELRGLLRDSLSSADSFAAAHFHPAAVQQLLDRHEAGEADHSQRLYALLMLELWHRQFA